MSIAKKINFTQDVNYKKSTLPNGIRVVTEEIPYVRSISVGVWIDTGSRDEDENNNGITHFIEHIVFKGTQRFSNQQIARSLESVGGYMNAFTTKEHTCFYARILDEHLNKAIDVISDLVQYPLIDPKEVEKEKHVILEELKNIEDNPDDVIHDYFDQKIYYRHPLGFPVIGKAENIKRFTSKDLLSYIQTHFLPDKMVVAAAGNLKHENLVEMVLKYFNRNGKINNPSRRIQGPRRSKPQREVIEKPVQQVYICMGTLSCSIKNKMRYPLLVMNTLLGDGMSCRLFQNVREKYGFAYAVYSFANLMSDTGSFGIYVGTDNKNIERSISLIYKELEKLKTKPVSTSELNRTKSQMKGNMMLGLENMSNRMMRLGSGELYFGRYIPLDELIKCIDEVNQDQIYEVANDVLDIEKFSTVIMKSKDENGQLLNI